jgi:DNA replication licensing factor MCM3
MIQANENRLVVSLNHIRSYNKDLAEGLLNAPSDYLLAFDKALRDTVQALVGNAEKIADKNYFIGLEGAFGDYLVSPRVLNASFLGKMICIEGIVTKCKKWQFFNGLGSLVRPKVVRSVHFCEKTQVFHAREYRDGTHLGNQLPTGSVYPKEDENGNPLTTEFGLCTYKGHQTISLQEMPERAPAGQLPRPIDIILDDDLVDRVKPGDRVQVFGVYRSIGKHAATVSATFK